MTPVRWIIFAAVCIVTLGGLVLFSKKDSVNVENLDPTKAISETTTEVGDRVYGNKSSKVVLIEYGDFQCPGCGAAFPNLKTIKETYKDQIAFMFRNYPLTNIHPNALAAATAAEAAGLDGKYWEMHDKLYQNQTAWSDIDPAKRTDIFAGYAEEIGLNVDTFKTNLSDKRIATKIARDRAFGQKLNVDSTPTVFINEVKVGNDDLTDLTGKSGEALMDKLDAALKANNVTPPKR